MPSSALATPAPSSSAVSVSSSLAPERALAGEDRDLLALVEHAGRALEVLVVRKHARARVADAGEDRAVLARRRLDGLLLLDVTREDEGRDAAPVERDADRAVDQVARLRGLHADLDELGDVLEEHLQVDLLLVGGAERHAFLLADDREDGRVVELGVVEAVQQVDRTRAGGGDAAAELVGELRVPAGHEGRHLLVARLDELGVAVSAVEGPEEAVDPVAGVAVHAVDARLAQALQHVVRNQLRHLVLLY